MARVTIDDCIKLIPNRFNLTLAATYRARQLTLGSTPLVEAGRLAFAAGARSTSKTANASSPLTGFLRN